MSHRRVRLHIDQIVLHGVDPGDKRAFEKALRDELGRLLAVPSGLAILSGSRALGRADGGVIRGASKPSEFGRAVAGAAFKGVMKP